MIDTKDLMNMARQASELALRLASLPADGLRQDVQPLDDIEQLATRILKESSAARARSLRTVGETSGTWRIMHPAR
jgi:hypothetical protein